MNTTPKEKAQQLVIDFFQFLPASKEAVKGKEHLYYNQFNAAKKCAAYFVNEVLESANLWTLIEGKNRIFWNEVHIEIWNFKEATSESEPHSLNPHPERDGY